MTLSASIFNMQPEVIPFNRTPAWFFLSVFLLIGMMFVVHFIMRNHHRFQRNIAFWVKHRLREERLEPGDGFMRGAYSKISNDDEKPEGIEAFGDRAF
jgi:hypothetical protein